MERDEILKKLRERIVPFAASKVSREVAEDLAQEVLIVLHEKYRHVTEFAELVPLSLQILRFKMLDFHRKSLRRGEYSQVAIEDVPLAHPDNNPGTEFEHKELVQRIMSAVTQLSPRCRQLFRWKLEGKSFVEIKSLLGQHSINTVYTWDFRCRQQLLELMGGSWEAGSNQRDRKGEDR